jgi:UDP-galactopyranose mutase
MVKRVAVVGAGWAGSSCARALFAAGVHVEVFEATMRVGGHARVEMLNGVVHEPNGPHIFHTNDERAARWVRRFGMRRRFDFRPRTRLVVDGEETLLSWPLRLDELQLLPQWPLIAGQLAARPAQPDPTNLETWSVSLLGEALYRWFVYGYTRKQWGCEPSCLSSGFAQKRLNLRPDGRQGLFADRWQYFPARGVNSIVERLLRGLPLHLGTSVSLADLTSPAFAGFDSIVVTAPLDEFAGPEGKGRLVWRGVRVEPTFHDTDHPGATHTPTYVINEPRIDVPFTRTVETKHASGQRISGTVVCKEYPGAPSRHYPVHTPEGRYETENERLKDFIRQRSPRPVLFCGRLANYCYINQDEAILQGLKAADEILLH